MMTQQEADDRVIRLCNIAKQTGTEAAIPCVGVQGLIKQAILAAYSSGWADHNKWTMVHGLEDKHIHIPKQGKNRLLPGLRVTVVDDKGRATMLAREPKDKKYEQV